MKKYLSLMSIPALMTLNSCLQEDIVKNGGQEVTAKVSITLPGNGVQSRNGATTDLTSLSPTLTNNMRLYIFVYQNDKIVKVVDETADYSNTTSITKDIRLVTGQPYKIAAWVDFGSDYYTVDKESGVVTLPDYKVTGNEEENDAYYALNNDVVLDANTTINLTLTRPFGLIQITTEDWQQDAVEDADLQPNAYETTISVPTKLTLLSGEASEEQDVTFAGTITDGEAATQRLSFDYVLAGANEAELADFTMAYTQDEKDICEYTFTNIPVRRNYITNITGNVLTKNGAVKVTIDQDWTAQINKELVEVESTADVNTAVSNAISSMDNVTVKVAGEVTTDNDDVTLPAVAEGKTVNLIFDNVNTGATLTIKESTDASNNVSGNVNVTVPQTQESNVNIELPNAHVTVNGKVNTMTASTSATTLVVAKEATIGTLTVKAGNVDIYGTVNTIARAEENNNEVIVTLYDVDGPTTTDEKIKIKKVTTGQIVNKTTGKSYATIGDAVLAAKANEVIELAEGEYDLGEPGNPDGPGPKGYYLNIKTPITLVGKGNVTITTSHEAAQNIGGVGSLQNLINVNASDVTIKDITFKANYNNYYEGPNKIVLIQEPNFTIENCTFVTNEKAPTDCGAAVYFAKNATNGSVKNCTINYGCISFDGLMSGNFNIIGNKFIEGLNNLAFTTPNWTSNDVTASKLYVNIENNKFERFKEYAEDTVNPAVRAYYGILNLKNNTFPTNGVYWKATKFGSIFVNYNSLLSQTWKKDRTEPISFAISNDIIEFETQKAPANTWYAWHGRKAAVNMNAKASWTAEATLAIPETTRPVRQSIWYNVKDAADNPIDWAIVGYKVDSIGTAGYFETWDAHYVNEEGENTGLWSKVNISELNLNPGDKATVKFSMNGDTMTVFINNIQVYTYKIEGTTASKPAEVILNSYSYGESYKTIWTYPVVK